MATGSPFLGRDIKNDSGNVLNNPLVADGATREMLAKSLWGGVTVDVDQANGGLLGITSTDATGVVKSMDVSKTSGSRQVRFAYQKELNGLPPTFGQQIASRGDKNQFAYMDVEIAEVRSPLMPVHTDMEQRDGNNTLSKFGGSEALARRNVQLWCGQQYDADHYTALLRGASDVYLAPESIGGLGKDIGGVIPLTTTPGTTTSAALGATTAGSPTSHENVIAFDGAAGGGTRTSFLQTATVAARGYHEDNVAAMVGALAASANQAANKLDRDSLKGLYAIAARQNLRKLNGKNYDYILRMDWEAADQLIGSMNGTGADTASLVGIWKLLSANSGRSEADRLTDARYNDLIIDGFLIQPDRTLQAYRPTPITTYDFAASDNDDVGKVLWGCGSTATTKQSDWYGLDKFRTYDTNLSQVAVSFILGDTALVKAVDGGITMMEKEGDFQTGKEYGSREWRTVRRAVWQGRDANTSTFLRNEGSMLVLSCVDGSNFKL